MELILNRTNSNPSIHHSYNIANPNTKNNTNSNNNNISINICNSSNNTPLNNYHVIPNNNNHLPPFNSPLSQHKPPTMISDQQQKEALLLLSLRKKSIENSDVPQSPYFRDDENTPILLPQQQGAVVIPPKVSIMSPSTSIPSSPTQKQARSPETSPSLHPPLNALGTSPPRIPDCPSPVSISSPPSSPDTPSLSSISNLLAKTGTNNSVSFFPNASASIPSTPLMSAVQTPRQCRYLNCMVCARGPPNIVVKCPTWSTIMRVVFYTLSKSHPDRPFFNLRTDVYSWMVDHWDILCQPSKDKNQNWRKQVQDMLSHSKNLFESGTDHYKQNGFWRLKPSIDIDPWTIKKPQRDKSKISSSQANPGEKSGKPKRSLSENDLGNHLKRSKSNDDFEGDELYGTSESSSTLRSYLFENDSEIQLEVKRIINEMEMIRSKVKSLSNDWGMEIPDIPSFICNNKSKYIQLSISTQPIIMEEDDDDFGMSKSSSTTSTTTTTPYITSVKSPNINNNTPTLSNSTVISSSQSTSSQPSSQSSASVNSSNNMNIQILTNQDNSQENHITEFLFERPTSNKRSSNTYSPPTLPLTSSSYPRSSSLNFSPIFGGSCTPLSSPLMSQTLLSSSNGSIVTPSMSPCVNGSSFHANNVIPSLTRQNSKSPSNDIKYGFKLNHLVDDNNSK